MNVRLPQDSDFPISSSHDLYPVMQSILLRENRFSRNQEHFWVVGLDNASKILFIELIGLGRSNRVEADAPTVFRMAIYKMASRVILVHNHPSGNITPSDSDIDSTDHKYKSGKILLVEVIDHLIISEKDFFSFADKGLMESIKKSGKYEVPLEDQKELLKLKAKHENSIAIAKKMLKKGYDLDVIRELTGLRKVDIEEL